VSDKSSTSTQWVPKKPWRQIWIRDWWGEQHRELEFINEPFNNSKDVDHWRSLGYTQSRFTGDMYDMRFSEPGWIDQFRTILPVKYFSWSVYRMRPGDILPNHSDTYTKFRSLHDIQDISTIRRYVIFLEDWASGHYFEIDGTPVVKWTRGTAVYWHGDTPHLAANIGMTPRYTLQITGVVEPGDKDWRLAHANDSITQ